MQQEVSVSQALVSFFEPRRRIGGRCEKSFMYQRCKSPNQESLGTSSRVSWTSHQRRSDEVPRCMRRYSRGTRAVKCMRCSTCERMSRPHSYPTDGERFNERVFVDLCDVVDVRGNRYWWLVAVDQHTDNTVIAPCPSHEGQAVAKKIFKRWIRWAGHPDVLVCDGERGLGASEIFTKKLAVSGTQVQTTAVYSPWQKGRVEQRIATIKEVAGKTILQIQMA